MGLLRYKDFLAAPNRADAREQCLEMHLLDYNLHLARPTSIQHVNCEDAC
jgi:hypothetical protein